jgi:hypothetical protein
MLQSHSRFGLPSAYQHKRYICSDRIIPSQALYQFVVSACAYVPVTASGGRENQICTFNPKTQQKKSEICIHESNKVQLMLHWFFIIRCEIWEVWKSFSSTEECGMELCYTRISATVKRVRQILPEWKLVLTARVAHGNNATGSVYGSHSERSLASFDKRHP